MVRNIKYRESIRIKPLSENELLNPNFSRESLVEVRGIEPMMIRIPFSVYPVLIDEAINFYGCQQWVRLKMRPPSIICSYIQGGFPLKCYKQEPLDFSRDFAWWSIADSNR